MIIPALIALAIAGAWVVAVGMCRASAHGEAVGAMHVAELQRLRHANK